MFKVDSLESIKDNCGLVKIEVIPLKPDILDLQPKNYKSDLQQIVPKKACDCKNDVLFEIY